MYGWLAWGGGGGSLSGWLAGWWGCHLPIMERKEDRRRKTWQNSEMPGSQQTSSIKPTVRGGGLRFTAHIQTGVLHTGAIKTNPTSQGEREREGRKGDPKGPQIVVAQEKQWSEQCERGRKEAGSEEILQHEVLEERASSRRIVILCPDWNVETTGGLQESQSTKKWVKTRSQGSEIGNKWREYTHTILTRLRISAVEQNNTPVTGAGESQRRLKWIGKTTACWHAIKNDPAERN